MKTAKIILAASGVCGVVAWGICGSSHSGEDTHAMVGLALFGLSALGLVVGFVWLVAAAVMGGSQR